jgi:hypothetical protein
MIMAKCSFCGFVLCVILGVMWRVGVEVEAVEPAGCRGLWGVQRREDGRGVRWEVGHG